MTPSTVSRISYFAALLVFQAKAVMALEWGPVGPQPELPAPPQWRESATEEGRPDWDILSVSDSNGSSLLPWELVPANEVIATPTVKVPTPPLLTLAQVQDLLATQLPSRDDYLPLLRLGQLPTASLIPEAFGQWSFQQVSPTDGGLANGTGNQNYGTRFDYGLTPALMVSAYYTYADDPLYASIPSRPAQPANLWEVYGGSMRARLAGQGEGAGSWQLAAEGALELFSVGSGCGGTVSCDDAGTPNIFNDSGQAVFTRNWVGALSFPLYWQANRNLQLSFVPAVSFLPDSQGSGQGGAGEFYGTNISLGLGASYRLGNQVQLFGSAMLPLGPGNNAFNGDLVYSRVPILSAGANIAMNPRIGLEASITNGFGLSPATAILALPSAPTEPMYSARFTWNPGAIDSPEIPFTPRSRSLSLGGLTVNTAVVPPSGTTQVWLNADSEGNLFGQLAYSLSNDFQLQVVSAGEFNQVTPITDLVSNYANDGSLNARFGGKAVFLHQLRGAPFSLAGTVTLGQNRGSSFQGYLFADLAATWEANHWLAFNLNPKLAWSGVATPVGIGLGANLQLARNFQLIPEFNWVTSSAGDSNAALTLRWLPSATTAIDLYVSNAAGLLDMGQLLQTNQTRLGAKVTVQF